MIEVYNQLMLDLKTAGIKKGMVLMVHASFKSLGYKNITPERVIEALKEVLTNEGTLLMPTLSYKTVNKDNPYFSYHQTKSCVGIISETFRKEKDVYRSFNPVHSVAAWGKHAEALTKYHHLDQTTIGPSSPFQLMLNFEAKILMLGCGLQPNTFMHLIENNNHLIYREPRFKINYTMLDEHGVETSQIGFLPDMSGYIQRYDRIENILTTQQLQKFTILDAPSYLIDASALMIEASTILKEQPFYFVDILKSIND